MAKREHDEGLFGSTFVLLPKGEHTHTAILLHGRGSTGQEFADDLMVSSLSTGQTLQEKLPRWRWVFPSARDLWSTAFQEHMPAWFETHSLTNIAERQDLQVDGIRESVRHVLQIVEDEMKQLHGSPEKLALGGISQGAAVGLWALLCRTPPTGRLGGFVGARTWLPFATNIERIIASKNGVTCNQQPVPGKQEFDGFVEMMMPSITGLHHLGQSIIPTPVFLSHGVDDAYVGVELGRQAAHVLLQLGMTVEWKEYSDAEEEGHWFKVPEEMDDIHRFLQRLAPSE